MGSVHVNPCVRVRPACVSIGRLCVWVPVCACGHEGSVHGVGMCVNVPMCMCVCKWGCVAVLVAMWCV